MKNRFDDDTCLVRKKDAFVPGEGGHPITFRQNARSVSSRLPRLNHRNARLSWPRMRWLSEARPGQALSLQPNTPMHSFLETDSD